MSRTRVGILACLGAVVALAGCPSDDSENGGGVQGELATSLQHAFGTAPALIDGLERLLVAAAGGPQDGVTITPNASGFTSVISVDLDNDGTRETPINGTAVGQFGGLPTAVSFNAPNSGESVSANVENLGTDLSVYDVGGDFPGMQETIITGGEFFVSLESGNLSGQVDIEVLTGEDPLGATVHFEPDGAGGWHLRVTGRNDSFEFFVPLRAAPTALLAP